MDFNVADEITHDWQSEDIPDTDFLYMRVHKNWFQPKQNITGLFKPHGDGMSTDWSYYATPQETRTINEIFKTLGFSLCPFE